MGACAGLLPGQLTNREMIAPGRLQSTPRNRKTCFRESGAPTKRGQVTMPHLVTSEQVTVPVLVTSARSRDALAGLEEWPRRKWLNGNAGAVQALAALGTLVLTSFVVWATRRYVRLTSESLTLARTHWSGTGVLTFASRTNAILLVRTD